MATFVYDATRPVTVLTCRINTLAVDTALARLTFTIVVYALSIGTTIMAFAGTLVVVIYAGASDTISTGSA